VNKADRTPYVDGETIDWLKLLNSENNYEISWTEKNRPQKQAYERIDISYLENAYK